MVDAFIYMYFVGAGVASGVGTIVFIGWKVYTKKPKDKKTQKRSFAKAY